MKLGFFAPALRMLPLPEVFTWAGKNGFETVELWTSEDPSKGSWFNSFINTAKFDKGQAAEIKEMMQAAGLEPACVSFTANMLDPAHSEKRFAQMRRVIDAANLLGMGVVGCWAGRDYDLKIEDNIKLWAEKFKPLCEYAADKGVKLAMEGCPLFWERQGLIGNIAISPDIWDKMFDALPMDNIGLNYDPSHTLWMQIDVYRIVKEFKDKIFWFHAKDSEIDEERLAREGNIPFWAMTWRNRVPGFGLIDWAKMCSLLYEHGYRGFLSIEYEDMPFGYSPRVPMEAETIKRGLQLGAQHLKQFMM